MNKNHHWIIDASRAWIGTPYRHQASRLGVGCDCLGLVRGVWRMLYGEEIAPVPPYVQFGKDPMGATQLLNAAQKYLQVETGDLCIGHVVLFQVHKSLPPRHCGVISGETSFIHAQERLGVIEVHFGENWRRRIHSTYSFPAKV